MPLRPARCYTHQDKPPYTRREYIHGIPPPKITKFVMGNVYVEPEVILKLVAIERGVVRHNALEAARIMSHKYLASTIGDQNYMLVIKVYPHHVLRENKMMAFAGADRLQDGMRLAFGKPIGTAARVEPGTEIVEVRTFTKFVDQAKEALRRAASKLSVRTRIIVREARRK